MQRLAATEGHRTTTTGSRWPTIVWLGLLVLLYVGYLLMFLDVGCGLNPLTATPGCRVLQAFLLLGPFYIGYLWTKRDQILFIDYQMTYIPFVAWYVAFLVFGPKGKSNFIVEVSSVAILLGLYLLRFPISGQHGRFNPRMVALAMGAVVVFGAILIAYFVPFLLD